jgi:hypothetical protein
MAVRGGRARLRVERAVDATVFTFKNIPTLLRLGLFPALIALAISYALTIAAPVQPIDFRNPGEAQRIMDSLWLFFWVPSILFALAATIYVVGIHRFILRGERPGWVIARFGRYELAFVGAIAIVCAAIFVFDVVFGGLMRLIDAEFGQSRLLTIIAVMIGVILIWLPMRLSPAASRRRCPGARWRGMSGGRSWPGLCLGSAARLCG